MSKRRQVSGLTKALPLATAIAGLFGGGNAFAFEIDSGNPDVQMRWDNTVRYTYGKRHGNQDSLIIPAASPAVGTGWNNDDGDRNFKKGDTVTNRLDLLSEFDYVYKKAHGFRISGAAWRDRAYDNLQTGADWGPVGYSNTPDGATSRYGLSGAADRLHRSGGEILDAFVFTKFDVGSAPTNVKLGKHTVFWGESISAVGAFNGIAYAQSSIDLAKAAQLPGAEAKELFRPRKALTVQSQVSQEWSVSGQYMFGWEPVRVAQGGAYLGASDVLLDSGQFLNTAVGQLPRSNDVLPEKRGDWGLSARWDSEALNGTLGLYARRYTDILPSASLLNAGSLAIAKLLAAPVAGACGGAAGAVAALLTNGACAAPVQALFNANIVGAPAGLGSYELGYATNIKLFGISFATQAAGVSLGSELAYRHNTPLATTNLFANNATAGATFKVPVIGASLPQSPGDLPIARGNTWHLVLNAIGTTGGTALYDDASWSTEINFVSLSSVTSHPEFYKGGDGYVTKVGGQLVGPAPVDKATRSAWNLAIGFTPVWYQAFPGADITLPIAWNRGIRGNSPVAGITNEGAGSYSYGVGLKYKEKYLFDLKYVGYTGRIVTELPYGGLTPATNGAGLLRDRGQLLFTFKTTL